MPVRKYGSRSTRLRGRYGNTWVKLDITVRSIYSIQIKLSRTCKTLDKLSKQLRKEYITLTELIAEQLVKNKTAPE